MKVKICGITNLADAQAAVAAGADYLGFIFYPPSKRAITVPVAQRIVVHLRAAATCPVLVGVFVNETAATIAHILDVCRLDLAQLSGEEVPALIGDPASPIYGRAYKALRPTSLAEAEAEAEWYLPSGIRDRGLGIGERGSETQEPSALPTPHFPLPTPHYPLPTLLIDTYHPTLRGGSGTTGDWTISARLAQSIPGLMLAGGLTADNVAEAVRQVQPYAVDVASGVEARPGQKDHALVRAFVAAAKLDSEW
jgi:phosphoribosylanthranilate isomerase